MKKVGEGRVYGRSTAAPHVRTIKASWGSRQLRDFRSGYTARHSRGPRDVQDNSL